jgi:hypothetical protein
MTKLPGRLLTVPRPSWECQARLLAFSYQMRQYAFGRRNGLCYPFLHSPAVCSAASKQPLAIGCWLLGLPELKRVVLSKVMLISWGDHHQMVCYCGYRKGLHSCPNLQQFWMVIPPSGHRVTNDSPSQLEFSLCLFLHLCLLLHRYWSQEPSLNLHLEASPTWKTASYASLSVSW